MVSACRRLAMSTADHRPHPRPLPMTLTSHFRTGHGPTTGRGMPCNQICTRPLNNSGTARDQEPHLIALYRHFGFVDLHALLRTTGLADKHPQHLAGKLIAGRRPAQGRRLTSPQYPIDRRHERQDSWREGVWDSQGPNRRVVLHFENALVSRPRLRRHLTRQLDTQLRAVARRILLFQSPSNRTRYRVTHRSPRALCDSSNGVSGLLPRR